MKTGCVTGTDVRASTETPSPAVTSGCDLTKHKFVARFHDFRFFDYSVVGCGWKSMIAASRDAPVVPARGGSDFDVGLCLVVCRCRLSQVVSWC